MDADRFDAVVRSVSTNVPRRRHLMGLSGLALAGLAHLLGLDDAAAKGGKGDGGHHNKKKGKKKQGCPDGTHECPGGGCASDGSCCSGEKECGGGCISASSCCPLTEVCCNALAGEVKCVDKCCDSFLQETCYEVTRDGKPYTGVCKRPCDPEYTICKQLDGTPVCCHTERNPPPAQCVAGECISFH